MEIFTLRNPNALMVPEVYQLLERALNSSDLIAPGGLASVAEDLLEFVRQPDHFLILGAENGQFRAVVLASLPRNNLYPYPLVHYAYNEGSRELLNKVSDFALDIFVQNGYTKVWTINASKASDKAWLKAFRNPRIKETLIGGAFSFEVV